MVEHVTITDPQIHEPKGVASASVGEVYVADGLGSGAWTTLATGGDMLQATYDPASISEQLVGLTATQTLTNKTIDAALNTITNIDLTSDVTGVLPLLNGGTGASTAAGARTNLGLVIGTDVQAWDAGLDSISALVTGADQIIYTTALDTYAATSLTAFARTLLDDPDAATMRTTLNVDVAGTDNSTDVTLGGENYLSLAGQLITANAVDLATTNVTGLLPITSGGTGANTAAGARTNLNVDVAGTDNSTDVTLLGENYLSLAGQAITANAINLASTNVSGILPIVNGGTGSSTAAGARTNLGLQIGSDIQAWDTALDDIAGLTLVQGDIFYVNGSNNIQRLPAGTANDVLTTQGAGADPVWATPPGAGGGEANTASNVGGFSEVFRAKVGVDLEFRTLQSSDASVTITQNANDIDLTVVGGAAGEEFKSIQVFTTSATWIRPAGITTILVKVIGGGGGGGGALASAGGGGTRVCSAGGGASGGYAEERIDVSALPNETVTVGTGGVAGTSAGGTGGTGNTSSFGAFCSATGGSGGLGTGASAADGVSTLGGQTPGNGVGSDIDINGSGGSSGRSTTGQNAGGGNGAPAPLGNGGGHGGYRDVATTIVPDPGTNGGGGGGAADRGGAGQAGGVGGDGLVIVYEFGV